MRSKERKWLRSCPSYFIIELLRQATHIIIGHIRPPVQPSAIVVLGGPQTSRSAFPLNTGIWGPVITLPKCCGSSGRVLQFWSPKHFFIAFHPPSILSSSPLAFTPVRERAHPSKPPKVWKAVCFALLRHPEDSGPPFPFFLG